MTNSTAGELGPNDYRCECCGNVYEKVSTDEAAMAEAETIFGDGLGDDPAIVCDDCWRRMMGLAPAVPSEHLESPMEEK